MRPVLLLTVLVALSGINGAQCAAIPSDDHRIPNFENTIQNNASTIVVHGDQRVRAIAERTYTVPGTGRQIIFMSSDDYNRFRSSLPSSARDSGRIQGFRARTNDRQPPQPSAEPYSSVPGPEYHRQAQAQTVLSGAGADTGEFLSSGSRQWDSSGAWTTPGSSDYNYRHRYATGAREETVQQRSREREPYSNVLRLHRDELQRYNPDSEMLPDHRQRLVPVPVQSTRLRSLDKGQGADIEVREDAYSNEYTPGYRRYSDYALGGHGQEYRAAYPPAYPEPATDYPPIPEPTRPEPTYYRPRPAQSIYQQQQPPPAQGHGDPRRRSKCCVVTYTCMLVNGYANNGGNRDRGNQNRRMICGPKTTPAPAATPRPNDIADGSGRTRKCCCCCCYMCC